MNKTFKTLDEQIQILQNKGLIIDDIDYAKSYYELEKCW